MPVRQFHPFRECSHNLRDKSSLRAPRSHLAFMYFDSRSPANAEP